MLSAFLLFYHCDPEYYIMVLPLALAAVGPMIRWGVGVVGLSCVYAVNFAYGVNYMKQHGGASGKQVFVDMYDRLIPIDPGLLHMGLLVATILANVMLTAAVLHRLAINEDRPEAA